MDGRSISSRYDFSESENGSIHSGQGRTARTVSLARRYASTVSLFSLRRKQSLRQRGNGVRSAASELFLREKSDGPGSAERRPMTSYLFSLGKERDGLAEIIPQSLVGDDECDSKLEGLIQVVPASPVYPNDVEPSTTAGSMSSSQWRHSALLPLPGSHPAERPGTGGSSIYSEDGRGIEKLEDCASSLHSQESGETGGPRVRMPGQRLLRTRSLLSLAKRYSSHDDDVSIYTPEDCGTVESMPAREDAGLPDDDCSVYSRDERHEPVQRLASTRAGTISSTASVPKSTRDSCELTALPSLPTERDEPDWPLPSPIESQPRDLGARTWWRRSSAFSHNSDEIVSPISREPCDREVPLQRRPSSWSWLTINTAISDRTSSSDDRKSSEASILNGHRYIRTSVRASIESDMESAKQSARSPRSPLSVDTGIYRGEHRLSAGNQTMVVSSEVPQFFQINGWRAPKQDPLLLPPMQLPELPDEQRVSFYARCGHFETDPELIALGQELQGWCPECSKVRRSKRKIVKKELRSMLKSIAE